LFVLDLELLYDVDLCHLFLLDLLGLDVVLLDVDLVQLLQTLAVLWRLVRNVVLGEKETGILSKGMY